MCAQLLRFGYIFFGITYIFLKSILTLSSDTHSGITFTMRHVFHQCRGFINLSDFIGIFLEFSTPKLDTFFYLDYKSDKCSENNISNFNFLFQHLKIILSFHHNITQEVYIQLTTDWHQYNFVFIIHHCLIAPHTSVTASSLLLFYHVFFLVTGNMFQTTV